MDCSFFLWLCLELSTVSLKIAYDILISMINLLKTRKYWIVRGIIFLIVVFIAFVYFYPKYRDWKFDREIKQLTEEINRPYLEDTYGGQTPKETLEMFLTAIEKNDFDLASKYIVLSKQEEWRDSLINAKKENKLDVLIDEIKIANEEINREESIWEKNESYVFIDSRSVSFDFVKYPKGIWKIKEI